MMSQKRVLRQRRFRFIKVVSCVVSALLWGLAGFITAVSGNFFVYTIVGLLAMLFMVVSVNSAWKEGYEEGWDQ